MKDDARLDILEACNLLLQFHVNLHGSSDGAHRARTNSILSRRFKRRLAQLGMSRQPKIIVRSQIDYALAIECADGRLLVIENAQFEMRSLDLQLIELVS